MPLRDECDGDGCGHAPETHLEETVETGRVEESFLKVRTVCQAAWCDCPCYVPPDHKR